MTTVLYSPPKGEVMISSSLTKDEFQKERVYPYLGINKDSLVVLFNKERRGVVVHEGRGDRVPEGKIGTFSNRWNEGTFEVCTHIVHLKMTPDPQIGVTMTEREMFEASFKRPKNYLKLSNKAQWRIDSNLGILDWKGEGLSAEDTKRFHKHYS